MRKSNQDAFKVNTLPDGGGWAVVCDGMGGANGGNVASKMAIDIISSNIIENYRDKSDDNSIRNLLISGISSANTQIYEKACADPALEGMGTTVVCVLLAGGVAHIAHAGDSRAYLFNNEEFTAVTKDHSIIQTMLENGQLSEDEARTHPKKNIITRAVGVDDKIDVDYTEVYLKDDDALLICTDGLTNYVTPDDIYKCIKRDIKRAPKNLVALANKNGGGDNITVVLILPA